MQSQGNDSMCCKVKIYNDYSSISIKRPLKTYYEATAVQTLWLKSNNDFLARF